MVLFSFREHKDKKKSVCNNHNSRKNKEEVIKQRLQSNRSKGGLDPSGIVKSRRSQKWKDTIED